MLILGLNLEAKIQIFNGMYLKKGVSASPEEDNILMWNAMVIGPDDTPFEDGTFKLVLQVNLCQKLFFLQEHVVYKNCSECQKQFLYTSCSPHVLQKEKLLAKIYLYKSK